MLPFNKTEVYRFANLIPFREAQVDVRQRMVRCIILTEGIGNLKDKNYYTREAVASAAQVFNGKQFFLDHPSETEEHDRPERSVRDLGGFFYRTELGMTKDPDTGDPLAACFATLRFDNSTAGRDAFEKVKMAIEHQQMFPRTKDVYAGISINGGGLSEPDTINGMQVNKVTKIQEAFSADIVTKPARGGRFLSLIQEAERLSAWKRARTRT